MLPDRRAASASGPQRTRSSLLDAPHSSNRTVMRLPSAGTAGHLSISRRGVSRPPGSLHPRRPLVNERRAVEFAPKDAQLRDDVRTLGALVGDVLREQCGDAFFQLVERVRHAAIAGGGGGRGGSGADDELHALLHAL